MRQLLICTFFCFCLAACDLNDLFDADGGAADAGELDAGAVGTGEATLSGPLAFPDAGAREGYMLSITGAQLVGYAFLIENHGFTCSQIESFGGSLPVTYTQVVGAVFGPAVGQGPAPGTYQVLAQQNFNTAQIYYTVRSPDGSATGPFIASDGVVTLTVANGGELAGSFQADIPDANGQYTQLIGSFDAPYCP